MSDERFIFRSRHRPPQPVDGRTVQQARLAGRHCVLEQYAPIAAASSMPPAVIVGGNVGQCRQLRRRGADAAVSVKTDGASLFWHRLALAKIKWRPSTWVALAIGVVA